MPAPPPKCLKDATQDAVDMTRNLASAAGFSSSAVDPSVTCISVERTGLDENGNHVVEAADIDDSEEEAKVSVKTAGLDPTAPTAVRKDVHARLVLRMRVHEKMNNSLGNMHGGCGATLVDNITSMVLYYHTTGEWGSPWSFLGVSQNLNMLYLNACKVGSVIEMEVYSAQVGKSIALLTADFWLVERQDAEDEGSGPVHEGKWKRIRRTISGSHTKVDNSAQLKL
ncbi:uncharacterized protein MEPE_00159 [Melanopsichium pennsylvanicum]|uniref:Thioesterase domain-containing protein n=2 Tax=Melanopsichium pennsylvanicum TaxID=63383 RepID=A0AAJ4XFJ4_9BASI|nr:conserved hypothetical protein [Melanopsichium pennsylvanicum 4]SNX81454.1 uncharacterized protein MEPE_00159 [Melanopsichium pennsylvanicum]